MRFREWVRERHQIHVRRRIEDEDPPWTKDPILQSYHFCNPYRHLDANTRYYRDHIVERGDPEDVFVNTVLFRLFNSQETWDQIGFTSIEDWDHREMLEDLDPQYNSSYRTSIRGYETQDRANAFIRHVCEENMIPRIEEMTRWQEDPVSLISSWTSVSSIGSFIAYEIYCDLTHNRWFPHTKNDYLNVGPGAKRGIGWILGFESENLTPSEARERADMNLSIDPESIIETYVDNQKKIFPRLLDMPRARSLTLRDIEHSLCEFDKYQRAQRSMNSEGSVGLRRFR